MRAKQPSHAATEKRKTSPVARAWPKLAAEIPLCPLTPDRNLPPMTDKMPLPASIDDTETLLAGGDYVADRSLATALFLALRMGRPLFLEGEAGVGKTEIAKVLSERLGRRLV